jgi:cytochrome P450
MFMYFYLRILYIRMHIYFYKHMFMYIGRRGCVGQTLALLELKVVLATLFYSYDFEIISKIDEMSILSLKPTNADLKVTYRKK